MKSYSDALTGEKVYEYRCDDDGSFYDGKAGKTDKNVRRILNLEREGDAFSCKLNVSAAPSKFSALTLDYPYYFKKTDKTGAVREFVFGINAQKKLTFYEFRSSGTLVGTMPDVTFDEPPVFLSYNYDGSDYLLVNGGESGFYVFDDDFTKATTNPLVTNIAVFDGKLFACSSDNYPRVRFSPMSNPKNWSDYSSLYVYNECGFARGLALLKNYLYVFQEKGVSKISRADSDNYSVTKMFEWGEKIYPQTIGVSGSEAWYFTKRGLYSFDGSENRNRGEFLGDMFVGGEQSRIIGFRGKTIVATRLDFPEDVYTETEENYSGNNAIVVFGDGSPKVYCGIKVKSFFPLYDDDVLVVATADVGMKTLSDSAPEGSFKGLIELNESDFGTLRFKCVKSVVFSHSGEVEAEFFADGKKITRHYSRGKKDRRINLCVACKRFSARFIAYGGNISSPTIYYSEEI